MRRRNMGNDCGIAEPEPRFAACECLSAASENESDPALSTPRYPDPALSNARPLTNERATWPGPASSATPSCFNPRLLEMSRRLHQKRPILSAQGFKRRRLTNERTTSSTAAAVRSDRFQSTPLTNERSTPRLRYCAKGDGGS
jgi:hypothetical protein